MEPVLANNTLQERAEKVAHSFGEDAELKIHERGHFETLGGDKSVDFDITNIEKIAEQPKIAKFASYVPQKDFVLTSDGKWTLKEASSTENSTESLKFDDFEGTNPQIGDYGVFLTEKTASIPFEVTGKRLSTNTGQAVIKGEAGMAKVAFYPLKVTSDGFEKHENEKNAFYVPGNAKFVKLSQKEDKLAQLRDFEAKIKVEGLNGFKKVAFWIQEDTDSDKMTKIAENEYLVPSDSSIFRSERKESEMIKNASAMFQIHEIERDSSGLYNLRGNEFAKYAQEQPIRNLNELDAKWAALHCGATQDDLEKIASLGKGKSHIFEGKMSAPMSLTALDKQIEKTASYDEDDKLTIAKNLVKEAAYLRDKSTVDAVLSLSMMRKRNIEEYLAVLPTFEMAVSELAKLLISSRLGMDHTDPDAISNAMHAMSDVVIQLHKLQAAIKEVK